MFETVEKILTFHDDLAFNSSVDFIFIYFYMYQSSCIFHNHINLSGCVVKGVVSKMPSKLSFKFSSFNISQKSFYLSNL